MMSDTEIRQARFAIEHLRKLADVIQNATAGRSLYAIPIVYQSALDGETERGIVRAWGRTEADAIYNATTNREGHQWAEVNGPVTLKKSPPHISEEYLRSLLNIPIP